MEIFEQEIIVKKNKKKHEILWKTKESITLKIWFFKYFLVHLFVKIWLFMTKLFRVPKDKVEENVDFLFSRIKKKIRNWKG